METSTMGLRRDTRPHTEANIRHQEANIHHQEATSMKIVHLLTMDAVADVVNLPLVVDSSPVLVVPGDHKKHICEIYLMLIENYLYE